MSGARLGCAAEGGASAAGRACRAVLRGRRSWARGRRSWSLQATLHPCVCADLKALFPDHLWKELHLQVIFFGREKCEPAS